MNAREELQLKQFDLNTRISSLQKQMAEIEVELQSLLHERAAVVEQLFPSNVTRWIQSAQIQKCAKCRENTSWTLYIENKGQEPRCKPACAGKRVSLPREFANMLAEALEEDDDDE